MLDVPARPAPDRLPAAPGRPVVDPATWTGAEMAARDDWIHVLTGDELAALAETAARVRRTIGDDPNGLLAVDPAVFGLGALDAGMGEAFHQLRDGRGFQVIRGLPVADWDRLDLAIAYWAIGRALGEPLSNNPDGDMIGHVTDLGKDYDNPKHRGYQTRAHMLFHTDQCDMVALLCLQTSRTGGESKIVSAPAVHNEMMRRRPDLVAEFTAELYWTRHGETAPGDDPWYRLAVFNYVDGYLTTVGGFKHVEKGHALPGAPPLTAAQREAYALMAEINEELHLPMTFAIGDIQILNSHVTMHSRTEYEDWPEPERKRRLWRLWLRNPELRPCPAALAQRANGIETAETVRRIVL